MGVNRIDFGGRTLIDLTNDSVEADYLLSGETAHGADGEPIIGTNPYEKNATDAEVEEQARLIGLIASALEGKAIEGGGTGGVVPSGELDIDENGWYDVATYASVDVHVGIPDGYIKPSGTLTITENKDNIDVAQYAKVSVKVPTGTTETWTLTLENGNTVTKEVYVDD